MHREMEGENTAVEDTVEEKNVRVTQSILKSLFRLAGDLYSEICSKVSENIEKDETGREISLASSKKLYEIAEKTEEGDTQGIGLLEEEVANLRILAGENKEDVAASTLCSIIDTVIPEIIARRAEGASRAELISIAIGGIRATRIGKPEGRESSLGIEPKNDKEE
jgi:hypothetical protein